MDASGGAAPTGCFKCGRPGHWSRDCPSNPNTNSNPNPDRSSNKPAASSHPFKASGGASFPAQKQPIEKPKKVAKTRPKLTPELLLSDDGIGFVLRHFPKALKYHGRGHEVNDLGNLLSLYAEWHSHLIPYYSFDHFVHKVEQVGTSKRVKMCINDLRERIANGGDPTKLLETLEPHENSNPEQDKRSDKEDTLLNKDPHDSQHDVFDEIYENTTEEPSGQTNKEATSGVPPKESTSKTADGNSIEMSDEVKARMEANKLKALERAAARKRALESQIEDKMSDQEDTLPNTDPHDFQHDLLDEIVENTTEEPSGQTNKEPTSGVPPKELASKTTDDNSIEMSGELKARMEANRLKALERAAARKRALESQAS